MVYQKILPGLGRTLFYIDNNLCEIALFDVFSQSPILMLKPCNFVKVFLRIPIFIFFIFISFIFIDFSI